MTDGEDKRTRNPEPGLKLKSKFGETIATIAVSDTLE